jgi:hypothetical protein
VRESSASPEQDPDVGPEALAEALRAEHAAVYGYEYVGGAAEDEDRRERAKDNAYQHKALRDALHGGEAVDSYAVNLEETTVRAYMWLTASRDTDLRVTGARAMQEATVRALEWGGTLDVLPGFDEAG